MRARDLIYETASALDANRARSLLTILGIVIGIAAVIAMTAMIGGLKNSMVGSLGLSQARLVEIWCYYERPMTERDIDTMASEMSSVYEYVTPSVNGSAEVTTSSKQATAFITGVQPVYADAMNLKLIEGRFVNDDDQDQKQMVVVLDETGVRTLFGADSGSAVGKSVSMNGVEYNVIGVTEAAASNMGTDYVNMYMPLSTCQQRILGNDEINTILGFAYEDADMDAVQKATEKWLGNYLGIPDDQTADYLYVMTMKSIIDQLDSTMASFQILMTAVASISLVVGGIGIMNMMLTNVTERIREIGLRKALGARRRDITRQFLLESVCLTLVGGVIGIIVGYFGSFALAGIAGSAMMGYDTGPITPYLDWQSILLVAAICVAIGVIFGYYPARRAARLDPVESLHYQ